MKRLYRCTQCYLLGRKDCLKPPVAFGVYASSNIASQIIREGAWTRCLKCKATAEQCRIRNKLPIQIEAKREGETCEETEGARCTYCESIRPWGYFNEAARKNKDRNKKRKCRICQGIQLCIKCEEWLPVANFRLQQAQCKKCEDIKCHRCSKTLPQSSFATRAVQNHMGLNTPAVCAACNTSRICYT